MAEDVLQGCKLTLTYLYHHRITITHTILEFSFSSSLLPYAYIFATLFLAYGLLRTIFSLVIRGKWYVVNGHYTGRNGLVVDGSQTVVGLTADHHRSIFGASITLWLQHTNLVAKLTKHTNYHRIVTEKIPNNGK